MTCRPWDHSCSLCGGARSNKEASLYPLAPPAETQPLGGDTYALTSRRGACGWSPSGRRWGSGSGPWPGSEPELWPADAKSFFAAAQRQLLRTIAEGASESSLADALAVEHGPTGASPRASLEGGHRCKCGRGVRTVCTPSITPPRQRHSARTRLHGMSCVSPFLRSCMRRR